MLKPIVLTLWVSLFAHFAVKPHMPRLRVFRKVINIYQLLLAVPMIGLIGLRTSYNDTYSYIDGFRDAPTLTALLADPEGLKLLHNPLFELFTSAMRTLTDNYHIYFMVAAIVLVVLVSGFLFEISERDTYALTFFTYFAMGTYFFALAAMKQTLAMAVLCHGVLALRDKRHLRFCVLVFVAGLIHTYAWCFFIMLLLTMRPWKLRTYGVVAVTLFVMLTFRESITTLLEYGDAIGKGASEEMVFSGDGMNMLRVAVYSIVPICSFVFRPILEPEMERKHYIMIHMSIISFMFMLLASIDGANMFGRMARYFEMGTIYMFPWMIRHLFERRSQMLASVMYVGAFILFIFYQYRGFGEEYRAISWLTFFQGLI